MVQKKSHFERFGLFLKFNHKIGKIVGVDMVDPNYKPSFTTYFVVVVCLILLICYLHVMISTDDFEIYIEATAAFSFNVQGSFKLYLAITRASVYKVLYERLLRLHKSNDNNARKIKSINVCTDRCLLLARLMYISYIFVGLSYAILPFIGYLINGKIVTILSVYLPKTDPNTPIDYMINTFHQLCCTFYGSLGIYLSDMYFMVFVMHSIPLLDNVKIGFSELEELLLQPEIDQLKVKSVLNEIFQNHAYFIDYIDLVDDMNSTSAVVQFFASAAATVLSIFLFVFKTWIVGPFIIFATYFQMLMFCLLGTVVQHQNEILKMEIYNCSWYLLRPSEQKMISLMLMRAQRETELNVGPFAKLNVQTCLQMTKAIYSYLMMIFHYIETHKISA